MMCSVGPTSPLTPKFADKHNVIMSKMKIIDSSDKHVKRCSRSHVIRVLQIKIKVVYLYTSIKIDKTQNTDDIKCW